MNDCKDLAGVADAKFVQPLGLWVNSCKQRTYLLELDVKGESPSDGWGFFDLYIQYRGLNRTHTPTLLVRIYLTGQVFFH